ncbi:flavin-binding monooxygenase-like domain-containing protein [Ditylenchus destructor]|uniref:Flavin-containing monooxygenase n=1 Tax=Ditylenchus destructor TaxID=166010 RepID=A0AAD4ND29_9BILA|nr:flavin-binding monooxygenase-like domain-containing protein [Ditylenchus destructor]
MRVCIIGAGVSGLPSIKSCLEEGLEPVCYERTTEIGGLWNYRPDKESNVGGMVMKTTVVNTSKEMMAYSDFPPPIEWPNFMHHSFVQEYLLMYAKRFDLLKHIRFNCEVKTAERNGNGGWLITLRTGEKEIFDAIMLCTGHHSIPSYPQLRGLDKFKGHTMHAKEYRDFVGFEDKNVFIIGIGNSSLDIAVELAKIAKRVTVSTRRGSWITNRVAQGGMPIDVVFQSRLYQWLMRTLPWTVANDFMEHRLQQRIDHDLYGLRPPHRFFQQHPTVNDALANLLASGLITITDDVESFEEKSVIVKGGKQFPADIIIFATGYTFSFPYLKPQSLVPINNHEVDLYKFVFSPKLEESLAIIGLIQPLGSVSSISEMQSRWAAGIFSGRFLLPDKNTMMKDIEQKRENMHRRYYRSEKHTVQVDYIPYMDELAMLVGCKPPLVDTLLKDPRFALRLFVGANAPYVYRLIGPHSWQGARNAIWTMPERVKFPLKNRQCRTRRHKKRGTLDEYFRYGSMKWIAMYTTIILMAGLWTFCSRPDGVAFVTYFVYVFAFFFVFSFILLWFDLQYDMSTIF